MMVDPIRLDAKHFARRALPQARSVPARELSARAHLGGAYVVPGEMCPHRSDGLHSHGTLTNAWQRAGWFPRRSAPSRLSMDQPPQTSMTDGREARGSGVPGPSPRAGRLRKWLGRRTSRSRNICTERAAADFDGTWKLAGGELGWRLHSLVFGDLHARDRRGRGPDPQPIDEGVHLKRFAAGQYLDAAVGEIAGVPGDPECAGPRLCAASVKDTLHSPAYPADSAHQRGALRTKVIARNTRHQTRPESLSGEQYIAPRIANFLAMPLQALHALGRLPEKPANDRRVGHVRLPPAWPPVPGRSVGG
jgi:hypothetical protein